ncbi:hypothetical protein [Taibaiella koreensis]|uniref:hypothetical protein n=1 Tax=Taibaiella koreensis TaxID=1268548 RepID=UPI0013C2E500|nr:hypothetical protein [Taibaiella koreensis]
METLKFLPTVFMEALSMALPASSVLLGYDTLSVPLGQLQGQGLINQCYSFFAYHFRPGRKKRLLPAATPYVGVPAPHLCKKELPMQ